MASLNGSQFSGLHAPSMSTGVSQTASMSNPPTTMTGQVSTPGSASAITNAVKQTTGVSDFQAASRSFAKGGFGNTMAGIGHSIMGGINAASTASMAIPGVGEGIKGADIGLNLAIKGGDVFKAADATMAAEKTGTAAKVVSKAADTHLSPSQFTHETPTLYHGTGASIKPGAVVAPKPTGVAGTDAAWATPVGSLAERHAAAHAMGLGADKQMAFWSPVYKVSPVDAAEMSKTTSAFAKNPAIPHGDIKMGVTEFASKKGFTVDKVSHLVENPELTKPAVPQVSPPKPTAPRLSSNTRVLD